MALSSSAADSILKDIVREKVADLEAQMVYLDCLAAVGRGEMAVDVSWDGFDPVFTFTDSKENVCQR